MRSCNVTFGLDDLESERTFLEEYMISAWDRFQSHDEFDCAWFWRYGNTSRHGPIELEGGQTLKDGGVNLVVNGDPTPEPILEQERSRWRDLESEGIIRSWDTNWFHPKYENAREKAVQNFGRVGCDRAYRLRPIASEFTLALLTEFDERFPAVGTQTDDNPVPVGFWVMIHFMMKQQGYDWYNEIDACTKAIENRLQSLASFHGEDVACEKLDEVITGLQSLDLNE